MRPVIIPGYGRVSEGRFSSAFDFREEEEEEDRAKEGRQDGNPKLSCPKTSTGKIPLYIPALPPRLGGLLAPARSFERFE
jgi:hypothetical protein